MGDLLVLEDVMYQLYRLLAHQSAWTVQDLAQHMNVSNDEIRRALDVLADLGQLHAAGPAPDPRVLSADAGLVTLLRGSEAELSRWQGRLAATRAVLAAIAEEVAAPARSGLHLARRIEGADAVHARISEFAALAQTDCLWLLPAAAVRSDRAGARQPVEKQTLDRGVTVRVVYQDSLRSDPTTVAYASWLRSLAGEARTAPALSTRLLVVDRRVALVAADPADELDDVVETGAPGIVGALCALFDSVWAAATPFDTRPTVDERGLDTAARALLTLLTDGHTDISIARRLNVSERTLRRSIAALMLRLGARSRFQAGAIAAHRRWV